MPIVIVISRIVSVIFSGLFLAGEISGNQISFNETQEVMDFSNIEWAHAVNNRKDLERYLTSSVDFLEADVSMGHITGEPPGPSFPIMAHPPNIESDISLETWLDIVIARSTGKGIKLDFKTIDVVKDSLLVLQKHEKKITFPLWLNADILSGPVKSETLPVNASLFLKLCNNYFPNATLSVGWTTSWLPVIPPNLWHYSWYHVKAMADSLKCTENEFTDKTKLTFPVRAIFASRSILQLHWLLEVFPSSTLTVWSHKYDTINVSDLLKLRKSFNISQVYYDIPEPHWTEFKAIKNSVVKTADSNSKINKWWTMNRQTPKKTFCIPMTYTTKNSLFFSPGQEAAVLYKDVFDLSKGSHFQAKGFVRFVMPEKVEKISHPNKKGELVLALADISSFKKGIPFTDDTTDDTDIIWKSLNSSPLYVFQCDADYSSVYFFKLDTSGEGTFQVWKLSWYLFVDEDLQEEEIMKIGKPLIDKNKKFVPPPGPIMLGFISDGAENVIIYNHDIQGVVTSHPRTSIASQSTFTVPLAILFIILSIALF